MAKRNVKSASLEAARLVTSEKVAAGTRVSAASLFGDTVWNMRSPTSLPGASNLTWNFSTVAGFPGGFALALAEYAFHRLYKPVATHDRTGTWLTVANELVCLRSFANFCAGHGCSSFAEVDADLCYEFLWDLRDDGKSDSRIAGMVRAIYRLWEYRAALSVPMMGVPFGKSQNDLLKKGAADAERGSENRTPAIPESIYGPLMAAALDYVLQYSTPIIEARNMLRDSWDDATRNSRVASRSLGTRSRVVAELAEEVTGQVASPWLSTPWNGQSGIFGELQQLRRACIIVVLAYSGIRPSELLSLEAGCCVKEDAGGGRIRHYINTVLHKHRGVGAKDTWVVIEEVVRAIRLLEDLTLETRVASGSDKLFLSTSGRFTVIGSSRRKSAETVLTFGAVVVQIREFAAHCNATLDRAPIPDWDCDEGGTRQWRLNTRQFRRTLARYIARQPFGIIAGMLQYKHVETTCFEGYAGSEPDWNKMLAEEKVLASVNVLDEIAMDLSHNAVAGQLGEVLRHEFELEFKGRAEDYPPSQIAHWLASKKNNLFVGKFNFCFFNEEKALCTKSATRKDAPILNSCDPTRCSNACVGKRHAPLWQAQLDQATELMKHPKASELQRAALRSEVQHLTNVVAIVTREASHA